MNKLYWQIQKRGLKKVLYLGKGDFYTSLKGIRVGKSNCYFYIRYDDLYSLYKDNSFLTIPLEKVLEKVLIERPGLLLLGKKKREFLNTCDEFYEGLKLNNDYSFYIDEDFSYSLIINEY